MFTFQFFSLTFALNFTVFILSKIKILRFGYHSVIVDVLNGSLNFHQRPQRPRWPPLSGPPCPRSAPRLPPRAVPGTGPPPLWLVLWRLDPRPRCDSGSWPESQSGVGGGTGLGGEEGGCPAAAPFFLAGAGAGTIDSSLVLLFAGSPSSPPLARSAISFLAATLLALDVRWTRSPAQMLVPSTVVRS